ncbi:MAG: thiamine-phosphate synthase family protein [Candidatus ainarchaeum sp.]|nr:thiamine-phosphate synthase family protein [Candidatus ainarchaeum sp.]
MVARMREAVKRIEGCREFAGIIPEVRTNLVYARHDAKTPADVLAVDGRITVVAGMPRAAGSVRFGASSHVARLLLAVRGHDPSLRAAINFASNPALEGWLPGYCKGRGWELGLADRKNEPEEVRQTEGASMRWKAEEAVRRAGGKVPKIVYDRGGWGKEPVSVIFGCEPDEVAGEACELAKRFAEARPRA